MIGGEALTSGYFESALEPFGDASDKKCHCTFIYRTSGILLKPMKITRSK
jgi:hypothetical protein